MTGHGAGQLTRRGFLVLGAGTAAGAGLVGLAGHGLALADDVSAFGPSAATVLTGGYPRMLAFRQSEQQVRLLPYDEWLPIFAQFNGIVGKALQEERSDTIGPQTVDYFTRFKQAYPAKLVILHLNGRARLPLFETAGWSAGWWLHRAGSSLTAPIGSADTVLRVASTTPFNATKRDANGIAGDDIVLAPMGANGKPNFTLAEQVRLSSINRADSSLTVIRGRYGTTPRSFINGAYLASHEYAGPWSPVDDRVWLYNLATTCPTDSSGRQVVDVLLEQFAAWFGAGGTLAAFDGVELDVFQMTAAQRSDVDADCDGVVDGAMQNGVDTYLQGQVELTRGIRQILGSGRYLITDSGVGQQPDTASVNGVELEGFPTMDDYGMKLWSQALMTLELWRLRGINPRLSYPLFKFAIPNDYPVSFNRFRLTVAAALATNSVVSWFNDIGGVSGEPNDVVVWDEMVAGTAGTPGWLGTSKAPAIHLAERTTDLLGGAGVSWSGQFVATFVGAGVKFAVQSAAGGAILVVTRKTAASALTFTIPGRALNGPDTVLAFDVLAGPRSAYPNTVGRQLTVTVTGSSGVPQTQTLTVPTAWFHAVLGFHGVGPGPIDITLTVEGDKPLKLRGLRMFAAPDAVVRAFSKGAVFANPSGQQVSFDVAALFPGQRLARIIGHADQDPVTNDGSELGSTLTLGPLDALVVRTL